MNDDLRFCTNVAVAEVADGGGGFHTLPRPFCFLGGVSRVAPPTATTPPLVKAGSDYAAKDSATARARRRRRLAPAVVSGGCGAAEGQQ